jgi:hypothetical protein
MEVWLWYGVAMNREQETERHARANTALFVRADRRKAGGKSI